MECSDRILVSVVMACRNEAGDIERCLCSILGQREVPGEWEIVVADGLSDDGTREIVDRLSQRESRIHVLSNSQRTVSAGLNSAVRAAQGEVIIRMDAHTEYADDYIKECVRALGETGAANVGGPARTRPANSYLARAIAAAYHSSFSCGGARFHQSDYEGYVDTVTYGCWHKEDLEKYGLFDEGLIRNQDDELNLRITRGGGKIWQTPKIVSWYRPRADLRHLFRQYFQYGFWKVAVIRKHRTPASWRHVIPGLFVAGNCVAAVALVGAVAAQSSSAAYAIALLWGGACMVYLGASLLASIKAASQYSYVYLPVLPVIFGVFHVAYGSGFLLGLARGARGSRDLAYKPAVSQLTR